MEFKSQRTATSPENLSLVKAAAWAWHQRNSGGPDSSHLTREPNLSPSSTLRHDTMPRPSRYKLEALASAKVPAKPAVISLLDVYDVERISLELDRLIMSNNDNERRRRQAARSVHGFLGRRAVGICGARGDVVEATVMPWRGRPGMVV